MIADWMQPLQVRHWRMERNRNVWWLEAVLFVLCIIHITAVFLVCLERTLLKIQNPIKAKIRWHRLSANSVPMLNNNHVFDSRSCLWFYVHLLLYTLCCKRCCIHWFKGRNCRKWVICHLTFKYAISLLYINRLKLLSYTKRAGCSSHFHLFNTCFNEMFLPVLFKYKIYCIIAQTNIVAICISTLNVFSLF